MTANESAGKGKHGSGGETDRRVVDLVAECLLELEDAGSDGAAQHAVLERFCAAHPNHAEVIRRRIQLLGVLQAVEPASTSDAVVPAAVPQDRFGDFRLMNVIAQGGMGVVYRAVQESLGREVALKLIRPDHLFFPAARERFRREAEAVGRMQHPSIVPVLTVGETQGLPWFAMELVRGCSASEAISQLRAESATELRGSDLKATIERVMLGRDGATLPNREAHDASELSALFAGDWTQTCLAILREVLSGLEHAHRRGVLHRDLKPSNLMLTAEGRVLLLDFGLALNTERGERTALTAGIIGSAPYMAPEQFDLDRTVDERTDIYAAGVTLYELLTLKNPFTGNGVGTGSLEQRIREGAFPPLRSLRRNVDKDLEIVVAKAMATDPAERYPSAAAFRSDIENLLAHRPVSARPISAAARLWRVARLNPRAATAGVLAVVSAIALPTTLLWQEKRSSTLIQSALDRAEAESGRAERNLLESLKTVRAMIDTVGIAEVSQTPELGPARTKLIEKAVDLYQRFSTDNQGSRDLARAIAASRHDGAKLLADAGKFDEALDEFAACQLLYRDLREQQPNDVFNLRRTVDLTVDQVAALWRRSRFDDAVAVGNEILAQVAESPLRASLEDDTSFALSVVRLATNVALASMSRGEIEAAERAFGESVARLTEIASKGKDANAMLLLLHTRKNWEHVRVRLDLPVMESTLETARLAREFAEENPADFARESMLCLALMNAAAAMEMEDPRAIELLRDVIERYTRALDRAPDVTEVRYQRANAKLILRVRQAKFGNGEAAMTLAREVIEELEELAPQRAAPDYIANNFAVLVTWFAGRQEVDRVERRSYLERALRLLEGCVAVSKESKVYRDAFDSILGDAIELLVGGDELTAAITRIGEFEASCANREQWNFWLACVRGRILTRAASFPDPASLSLPDTIRANAMECLKQAILDAQVSGAQIDAARDLDSLRDDPEFVALRALAK